MPSLPNSHPWYLQTSCLSSEMNPRDSGAMRCGHESSTTAHAPPSPFHATMDLPSTFIGLGAVSSRKSIGDIGYHARAQSNRSPAAGASAGARSVVLDGGSEMDCARTAPPRADRRIARRGEGGASVSRWPVANAARPARALRWARAWCGWARRTSGRRRRSPEPLRWRRSFLFALDDEGRGRRLVL